MATGDYCTLEEIKARLWPEGASADTVSDTVLEAIISAASAQIDNFCGRRFWITDTTETRYFTTADNEYLWPDVDIVSITSIAVDYDMDRSYSTALDTDDYDLLPTNAALDGKPYSYLRISPLGTERFPTHEAGVQITGYFGWSEIPAAVKQATLIQAERLWKRRDAPFGMISNPAGGDMRLISDLDPDVQILLMRYRKWV